MSKAPDAFRTISEVAEWLEVQAHVLRFWESKFSQVKPVKRAGGRRYYRPSDMLLIGGIKTLLHGEGMTIKGVQKILREKGVEHVSSLSKPLELGRESEEIIDAVPVEAEGPAADAPPMQSDPDTTRTLIGEALETVHDEADTEPDPAPAPALPEAEAEPANVLSFQSRMTRKETVAPDTGAEQEAVEEADQEEPEAETGRAAEETAEKVEVDEVPVVAAPEGPAGDTPVEDTPAEVAQPNLPLDEEALPDQPHLPSFLHRSARPAPPPETQEPESAPEPEEAGPPKPRVVDAPDPPPEEEIPVRAGPVGRLARIDSLSARDVRELSALAAEIRALVAARVSAHEADFAKESGLGRGAGPTAPD